MAKGRRENPAVKLAPEAAREGERQVQAVRLQGTGPGQPGEILSFLVEYKADPVQARVLAETLVRAGGGVVAVQVVRGVQSEQDRVNELYARLLTDVKLAKPGETCSTPCFGPSAAVSALERLKEEGTVVHICKPMGLELN
ncbi:MAG: hypothetical protein M3O22_04715 [Pseudomonadota bacterium]|nr:hypothetical protein [Pseudomonadota bacterium]